MKKSSQEIAQGIYDSQEEFAKRIPSMKQANDICYRLGSLFGINASIRIYKYKGGKIHHSEHENDHFNFYYDTNTKIASIELKNVESEREIPVQLRAYYDKIFNKTVSKAFEKQGYTGEKNTEEIYVIAKLFNPVGGQTWYLYERESEDIFWAFVNLGNKDFAELGTVSMTELLSLKLPFGLKIERDLHFKKMKLKDVMDKVYAGGHV